MTSNQLAQLALGEFPERDRFNDLGSCLNLDRALIECRGGDRKSGATDDGEAPSASIDGDRDPVAFEAKVEWEAEPSARQGFERKAARDDSVRELMGAGSVIDVKQRTKLIAEGNPQMRRRLPAPPGDPPREVFVDCQYPAVKSTDVSASTRKPMGEPHARPRVDAHMRRRAGTPLEPVLVVVAATSLRPCPGAAFYPG